MIHMPSTWQTDLAALLAGPYSGHGGQTLLARKLGVKPRTLYTWRAGTRAPNTDHRQALAQLERQARARRHEQVAGLMDTLAEITTET
jgi:hypothetical protein